MNQNENQQAVKVSMEDFLRTGVFGPLKFGMTGEEIQAILGPPDFTFMRAKTGRPTGFEYGDVEFYFLSDRDSRLCAIYLDEFDIPRGNSVLALDPWRLRAAMSQADAEAALRQAGISFRPVSMPDPKMDGIVTASGVELGFIREPSEPYSPPAGLYNISRSLRDHMEA